MNSWWDMGLCLVILKLQVKPPIPETKIEVQWVIKLILFLKEHLCFTQTRTIVLGTSYPFQVPSQFLGFSESLVAWQPYVGQGGQCIYMHRTLRKSERVDFPLISSFLELPLQNTTLGAPNITNFSHSSGN